MKHIIVFQIVVAVLLTVSILLQSRGNGLGAGFGASDGGSYYAKRGFEKFLFYISIFLAALFVIASGINVFYVQRVL